MNPVEKLLSAVNRLLHRLCANSPSIDSSFSPKLPSPARRRNEDAEGAAVIKSATPLNASAPCSVEPAPCSTSIESIASSGIRSEEHTSELQSLRHLVC